MENQLEEKLRIFNEKFGLVWLNEKQEIGMQILKTGDVLIYPKHHEGQIIQLQSKSNPEVKIPISFNGMLQVYIGDTHYEIYKFAEHI